MNKPKENTDCLKPERWSFSDNAKDSDRLFKLVQEGRKTATSYLFSPETKPVTGYSILENSDKTKKLLLETYQVQILKFSEVTSEHAFREGEGDRTLKDWQKIHAEFFSRRCKVNGKTFSPDTLIVCEVFRVIKNL